MSFIEWDKFDQPEYIQIVVWRFSFADLDHKVMFLNACVFTFTHTTVQLQLIKLLCGCFYSN